MSRLEAEANARGLTIAGGFYPEPDDDLPKGTQTLLLLAPDGARLWDIFTASPFHSDGAPDPIDRWSRHVIGRWACDLGGKALFPFGGPPYRPFYSWALRSGRTFASPVGFLVHADQGLMISFRGALALKERVALPPSVRKPCATCPAPCLSACPVDALTADGYDVDRCKSYLTDSPPCFDQGCAVRRACPISQSFDRPAVQSAFHMKAFL
ncbi:MAG: ferredoxin [Pseudomonadota bacterium]